MLELGIDSISYHYELRKGLSLADLCRRAAAIGAAWVLINEEYLTATDERDLVALRTEAEDAGVGLVYSGSSIGGCASDRRASLADALAEWCDTAHALGSPFCRVQSDWYRTEVIGSSERIRQEESYLADVCQIMADEAERREMPIAIENHSNCESATWRDLVAPFGDRGLHMFLDLANGPGMLEQPETAITELGPLSLGGHVKNLKARNLEDERDPYYRYGYEVRWCLPSEGDLPLPAMLRLLDSRVTAPRFLLHIEALFPPGFDGTTDELLGREMAYLRESLDGAGA